MPLPLVLVVVALFAAMLLPLPAPFGIAMALWALSAGLPLPAVFALYLLQDLFSVLVLLRVVPWLRRTPLARLGAWVPQQVRIALRPATAEAGLISVTLLSFYVGVMLACLRGRALLRSLAIVITIDVLKYANGIGVALGVAHVLPSSPWTMVVAPLAGLSTTILIGLWQHARRPRLLAVPVRVLE
jgi:hypothetical protein